MFNIWNNVEVAILPFEKNVNSDLICRIHSPAVGYS